MYRYIGNDKVAEKLIVLFERFQRIGSPICTTGFAPQEPFETPSNLRRAFELFEQKAQLMRLMDIAGQAEGVRIFIGGESQVVPFEDLSIVSSPYEVDGKVVGTLGVIGPTRMPYDRMIQIVDITSKLVSNALSHFK